MQMKRVEPNEQSEFIEHDWVQVWLRYGYGVKEMNHVMITLTNSNPCYASHQTAQLADTLLRYPIQFLLLYYGCWLAQKGRKIRIAVESDASFQCQ